MEHPDITQDKYFDKLTDEEIEILISFHEEGNALKDVVSFIKAFGADINAVKNSNFEFQDQTLKQLKDNQKFQEALKKYREKYSNSIDSEIPEIIENLKSILPETFYITNNKLSNEMIKNFVQKGDITLGVINPNRKGEIVTYNSLTYEGKDIEITGKDEFTAYDRAIHNAVCSLYAAGNEVVTPSMVYRAVNGMSDQEKVSTHSMEAVRNSLDKSRFMRLKVDFSEEAKARNMNVDKVKIDSNLLEARAVTVEAGGYRIDGYKIHATPVLYQYSQRTKQIISVPSSLLDTKEATRSTEEVISIKEYLIRRIEIMKNDNTMSNKIVYDTIFEEVGIVIKQYTERNRYRKYIKDILSLWSEKHKYIESFKEYSIGKSFKGIEIFFSY